MIELGENGNRAAATETGLKEFQTAVPKTHAELLELAKNGRLTKGQSYIVTDFATKHLIAETEDIHTHDVEELVVEASSSGTFKARVQSTLFPRDVIEYDPFNILCEDGETSRKGMITYREDRELEVKFSGLHADFRGIRNARWKIGGTAPEFDPEQDYALRAVVQYNTKAYTALMPIAAGGDPPNDTDPDRTDWFCFCPDVELYGFPTPDFKIGARTAAYYLTVPLDPEYQLFAPLHAVDNDRQFYRISVEDSSNVVFQGLSPITEAPFTIGNYLADAAFTEIKMEKCREVTLFNHGPSPGQNKGNILISVADTVCWGQMYGNFFNYLKQAIIGDETSCVTINGSWRILIEGLPNIKANETGYALGRTNAINGIQGAYVGRGAEGIEFSGGNSEYYVLCRDARNIEFATAVFPSTLRQEIFDLPILRDCNVRKTVKQVSATETLIFYTAYEDGVLYDFTVGRDGTVISKRSHAAENPTESPAVRIEPDAAETTIEIGSDALSRVALHLAWVESGVQYGAEIVVLADGQTVDAGALVNQYKGTADSALAETLSGAYDNGKIVLTLPTENVEWLKYAVVSAV